ncbi:hypothetical protein GS429_10030 [Natronorubrum sp. JWXQ-INN-674]|uniref:Uncharacterized protein n=1 Tax=Natronorubrum halalkaliphilum TaxID=2691917 RepID=A0A6B0VMK2_9EURY|nr:hypothetical protein [Natronorubrum halalkaliphilum]MXV62395.1 hypothetical protein [Natronorubrum halalkaliphilum]
MIGADEDTELVDWQKTTDDGVSVYVLEYSGPVSAPTGRPRTLFGASSGGTVPAAEQTIRLPDGEAVSATDVTFEAGGTTLRVRCEKPSLLARIARFLPWWTRA